MKAKALPILITCLLVFLIGFSFLLRPHYETQVLEVVETYTRMKSNGSRNSIHRHPVKYAVVRVEVDGTSYDVTVRDNTWIPIRAGDTITVMPRLFGGMVQYRPDRIYVPTMLAAIPGIVALVIFLIIKERQGGS